MSHNLLTISAGAGVGMGFEKLLIYFADVAIAAVLGEGAFALFFERKFRWRRVLAIALAIFAFNNVRGYF